MKDRIETTKMGNESISFQHSEVPPSFNMVGARGHWKSMHYKKRYWQEVFELKLMATLPRKRFKRIVASASLRFPTKRRRDEGNYRAILEKAMGDALVNGGWLKDDTVEQFVFQHVIIEQDNGPARTTIHLRVEE
jgi:hypothetical protein